MNILFLDAYFYPEKIAFSHLERDIIEGLNGAGHNVLVICPVPTRGINNEIRKKYATIDRELQHNGTIRIFRFWAPQEKRGVLVRAIRYIWCNIRTYQKAKKLNDIDIIFSNSTPPTQGALGGIIASRLGKKLKKKIPFIYNLQDIFPDSMVNTGITSERGLFWKIGRKIEDYTYSHADRIIVISQSFRNNIIKKGADKRKIIVISNWVDLESVFPVKREDNALVSEFNLKLKNYIVLYAGNLGETQGTDIILRVADQLQNYEDIQFVIFGGGSCYNAIKQETKRLNNVFIHEQMPLERVSEVYSLGDVALITCKKGTGKAGLPSKIWSIMACNTPIIASFDQNSDLAEVLRESNAGSCVSPEDTIALKKEIIKSYLSWKQNRPVATNARNYVENNASKNICVKKYIEIFNRAVDW